MTRMSGPRGAESKGYLRLVAREKSSPSGWRDWREVYLSAAVLGGTLLVTITEALGAMHALTRPAMFAAWSIIAVAAFLSVRRRTFPPRPNVDLVNAFLILSIAAILGIVAFIAVRSPPNAADAMAYHMPRVVYWAQQRSVDFFPTSYLNQIMLQPVSEYFMLHSYLLYGGDRLVNLVQWFGCLTSIIGVSLIAKQFGAGPRGQVLAALFCATLPNGILQASGAKNDYLLAAWLVATTWFLLRAIEGSVADTILAGLSLGLALGTKATAYLYAPPLLLAILIPHWQAVTIKPAVAILLCAFSLNLPQYARNLDLSGSPLGFDSAQGDGRFRWRNETFGWRQTASNILRNSTEQLGSRNPRWNQFLYNTAIKMHADVDDPATTWPGEKYAPPRPANHEANAPNRWHLLILAACFVALLRRPGPLLWYAVGLVLGFVSFCAYLKWQPFMARMFLPLFVLASPIPGVIGERIRPVALQLLLCLLLLNNSRPYLFENWVRPLRGPHSLLVTSRDENYFADMSQWNNRDSHLESVEAVAKSGCTLVGLDTSQNQLEYPFQALLLERNPHVTFFHTGVANASLKYVKPSAPPPCAVLCLDCAGNAEKDALYRSLGPPQQIGRFLLFLRQVIAWTP
jgi:hypothetical protein